MKRSLLDTDVCSEMLKNRNPKIAQAVTSYRAAFGRLTLSSISVMEIVKGLQKAGQTVRLQLFLENPRLGEILSFDVPSADLAGRFRTDLERTGRTIGRNDPMIAGIAIHHGLVLVTANTDHFQRIQAIGYPLELANWRDE